MKYNHIIILLIALLLPAGLRAQFYVTGDDPGKLKWSIIDTDNYSLIYPEGADSLARVYGRNLERFRVPVSRTTGYLGGGEGRLRMPVVLHTWNTSNGSVAWAPKRMDLFTVPSAYEPEPMPWHTMLSVHESRHVTQMQFGMTSAMRPVYLIFGEMWNILASLLYPGLSNIEGDAVIAETALTASGRGRTADFLNYYKVAFDNGDFRRWDQWRLGSQRRYAPDHYALGYLTIGGFRYLYDCPMFMSEAYHLSARRPYNLGAFYTTTRRLTGHKYEEAFQEVCRTMHGIWQSETEARAPFIVSEAVTAEPRLYTDYYGFTFLGNRLYAIKKGHLNTPVVVRVDENGKEEMVSRFAYQTSRLEADERSGGLLWSETLPDKRWTMKADSRLRYMDADGGRKHSLTSDEKLLFNPVSGAGLRNGFADGEMAAASGGELPEEMVLSVRYRQEGGSSIVICGREDGGEVAEIAAPDSLQLVEAVRTGLYIYVSAISEGGYGIYRYDGMQWAAVLGPEPVKIRDLRCFGGEVVFSCDRTGSNEFYHFDPASGVLRQKTSLRYGGEDFVYSPDGRYLYYSAQTLTGKRIFRTPADSLLDRCADFGQKHRWVLAEKLVRQEREIAQAEGYAAAVTPVEAEISKPRRYRKAANMFNLHSWAPVYVNVDNIMSMSFDHVWQAASLGATGIMQNALATAVGEFGYSAHKDPYDLSKWRHSGHARFTYSGLYPVFEVAVNVNDRGVRQWKPQVLLSDEGTKIGLYSYVMDCPYVEGRLSMYIPFDFSSGGWYKGLIPRLSYSLSNDRFDTGTAILEGFDVLVPSAGGNVDMAAGYSFAGFAKGHNMLRQTVSGSLRGYAVLGTPNSAVYPRWGGGVEVGAYGNLESADFLSPMGYAYAYGYIPGFMDTHGVKLSATHQIKLGNAPFGQALADVLPRGLSSNSTLLSWLSIRNDNMTKATFDYAFPIYIGDVAIGGNFFSIKRIVVNPHFDYTFVGRRGLWSAGAELILDMHSILTLEWPCSFGVTYSYNGGSGFDRFAAESGIAIGRHYVGPTFNVTF
ncbi:MAG: hypothetical protein IJ005_03815 [Bacteroidales bacterium]|nr:hypothetical protein [Bacteroidales bacterium]